MRGLQICLIASSRYPIHEPFAGGLEAHTHGLALELRRRGHRVTLFAAPGSDPALGARHLDVQTFVSTDDARRDVSNPPDLVLAEHHAYLGLMLDLAGDRSLPTFDVIHNNSLHHLPIAMSPSLDVPVVTTLHTPPFGLLESGMRYASPLSRFVTVSAAMQRTWAAVVDTDVVPNGIDTDLWAAGPGGDRAFWFGRLVPEKAPHDAIDAAARAGLPIDLAGPMMDPAYFASHVRPRLGEHARYLGHLSQRELAAHVGRARVALVTPAWDEPFGLVAIEAMSTGTPVASYALGALPEIVTAATGALARAGDVGSLADAMRRAAHCDRAVVRRGVIESWSVAAMVDAYEDIYAEVTQEDLVA